jgi:hypothetical protein
MLAAENQAMPRIHLSRCAVALLLLWEASGQQPPDFSGIWEMDASRSESAHQAVPIGPVSVVIQQSANTLTVETRRRDKDKSPVSTETLTYKLDGAETTSSDNSGQEVKTRARWQGSKLVIESVRKVQGATVTSTHGLSLEAGGKELIMEKTLTVQHGYQSPGARNSGSGKDVFTRAKGSPRK